MKTVGLKSLKNNQSAYLRAAAAGETVQVTDRDRVVAEIVPPQSPANASSAEMQMAELVQQGIVTPAPNPRSGPPPRIPCVSFNQLVRELGEDRADR